MSRPSRCGLFSSERRRRVVVRLVGDSSGALAPAPLDEQEVPQVAREPVLARRTPVASVPLTMPVLRRMMQKDVSLTWLFTGDPLFSLQFSGGEGDGCFEAIGDRVRQVLVRREDRFVRSDAPQLNLRELFDRFELHVGRFSPQVVMILCGPRELQSYVGSTLEFERKFHALIRKVRGIGAVPVVNTPPWKILDGRHDHSGELIRLEAIRACAEESAAFLVDHWEVWQRNSTSDWISGETGVPTGKGVAAIVEEVVKVLQLVPEAATAGGVSVQKR